MSRPRTLLSCLARPTVLVPLLLVAALGWAVVVRAWLQELPVRRHLARGMEFARWGLGPEAEGEWKAALRLDRGSADAYRLLAGYYLASQRWSQAADALSKLRELKPKEPHVACQRAGALLSAGDEVGAYREAEAEIESDPNCVPALAIAAVMLGQVGDEQRRLAYLRRLARLRPDDADLLFMLGDALIDTHAHAEARGVLERVIVLDPEHPEALTLLGVAWLNDRAAPDHLARAESFLLKALSIQPLNGRARLTLGRVYLEQEKPREAVVQLEEAQRLTPYSFRVPFELTRAYEAAGEPSRAATARKRFLTLRQLASDEATLQKKCATDPRDFEAHLKMGQLQLRKEDYRKAHYYLRIARDLKPDDPRVAAALRSLDAPSGHAARLTPAEARVTAVGGASPRGAASGAGPSPGGAP